MSLNTGTIFNSKSTNNKNKKHKFTKDFTEEDFDRLSEQQQNTFLSLTPKEKRELSKMAPLQRIKALEEITKASGKNNSNNNKSNNNNSSNNNSSNKEPEKEDDKYHRPTILRKISEIEMRMKENEAKLEEYKKKPRHKRDREDIRKRNDELVKGPREIEKLKKDFRMSFVIFIKELIDYYKSLIEYNKNIIETKKKNKTFSEKSKELCLRYARVRVTNSNYSYNNYQVKVMFTEDARNYRKGYRDDWKVLKYNKDAYIIQTGDGSEHCLTKMLRWFKPRDDDDDGDQEEPIPRLRYV